MSRLPSAGSTVPPTPLARPGSASSRPGSAGPTVQLGNNVYAVPQSLVFRSFASWSDDDKAARRRLMLRNGYDFPVGFRLTLPSNGAFRITGDCVSLATFDTITSVDLPPGGMAALTVEFNPGSAASSEGEVRDVLIVRMCRETLHVPLAAVRDGKTPTGGDPVEKRTAPSLGEHWDDLPDSDDEDYDPMRSTPSTRNGGARPAGGRFSSERRMRTSEARWSLGPLS